MKKIILFLSCFLITFIKVDALTLSCPPIASPDEEITINLTGNEYNALKAKYNFNNYFRYQELTINSPWNIYYHDNTGFVVGNPLNEEPTNMNIKLKVAIDIPTNKEYTLSLTEINTSNQEYKNNTLNDLSCNIKIVNNINTLDNIIIDDLDLKPKFNKNTLKYEMVTNKNKINIKAIPTDNNAKVEGVGEYNLNIGANEFIIKVTSIRGNIREYKLYITRTPPKINTTKSNDAYLKSLTISSGKINFKKDKFLYITDIAYNIKKLNINAIPSSDKANVVIDNPKELVIGKNTIKIEVTAEDGTKVTYMIIVNKKRELSNDNTLKNIIVENYNLNFKKDKYNYNLEIDDEKKLKIDVIPNDNKATYKIKGNNNLSDGSIISIVVTAEDSSTLTYKILINKITSNTNITNNLNLISLIGFIILIIATLIIKIKLNTKEKI